MRGWSSQGTIYRYLPIMTRPSYSSAHPSEDGHREPRTLVLCFDGTANEFSERVSQSVDRHP